MKIYILILGSFPERIGVNAIGEFYPDKISTLGNFKHRLVRQVSVQLITEGFDPLAVNIFETLDMGF